MHVGAMYDLKELQLLRWLQNLRQPATLRGHGCGWRDYWGQQGRHLLDFNGIATSGELRLYDCSPGCWNSAAFVFRLDSNPGMMEQKDCLIITLTKFININSF